ncbi:MAG TPA: NAD-binding protein [Candidatus Acidoferrales bacterium]|nr:NAD-binding protein [Candidatus Acidoferrales bacterium]
MRIICVGYGRLGSQVVKLLDTQQHEVAVLDKERTALERHDRDLHARFFLGNAIDEELLRSAGAEHADALFALTRDENTNLMVAQIAKVVFNIPRIIAVVYDAAREEVFRVAGIETLPLTVAGAAYLVSQLEQSPQKRATFAQSWKQAKGHGVAAPMPSAPEPRAADQPFYVVVMGGGRVGYFLTRALRQNNIEVTVLENNPKIYDLITRQVDSPVILGDGSSIRVQEQAGMARANVFVAVTNHDQDNLIACQIAKHRFGVPKTIARVKNPRNEVAMQKLGVDITVSSTGIITALIQSEMPTSRIRTVLDLRTGGGLELMEYHLDSSSPVAGKTLRALELPPDCNIVTIIRSGDAIIARGETILQNGDTVLTLVKKDSEPAVRQFLLGSN